MSPEDCLERLRCFQAKFSHDDPHRPSQPGIFLQSLIELFSIGGKKIRSAKLCRVCRGYGVHRHGGCAFCSCLGYEVSFVRDSGVN